MPDNHQSAPALNRSGSALAAVRFSGIWRASATPVATAFGGDRY